MKEKEMFCIVYGQGHMVGGKCPKSGKSFTEKEVCDERERW
jgi:hypothetical protein